MNREDFYKLAKRHTEDSEEWTEIKELICVALTGKQNSYGFEKIDPMEMVRPRMAALADLLFLHGDEDQGRTAVGSRNEDWLTGIVASSIAIGVELALLQSMPLDGSDETLDRFLDVVDEFVDRIGLGDQDAGIEGIGT